jgi:F-type H+-transporting ATPase subunit b
MHVSLSFNLTLVVQAISFLVFAFLMDRLFFRPVADAIARRQTYIAECQVQATEHLSEGERLQEQRTVQLKEATAQAQAAIAAAVAEADNARRQAINQVSGEARTLIEKAREEIAQERTRALEALQGDMDDLKGLIKDQVLK